MSLNPKLSTFVPGRELRRTRVVYHPESLLHRLTGLSLLALAEEPYMNCSTPESSAVLDVDRMEKPSGVGFGNSLLPGVSDLTEKSLEQMLIEIKDAACALSKPLTLMPTHAIVSGRRFGKTAMVARALEWRGWESWSLRQRRLPNTRLARVAREEVEDGLIPSRSIRGWSFVAEFAYVDRRRVKRLMRRHYKESRNVPVRNYGAGHQRVRA